MEIINKMSIGYINKMNESFLLSVTDHLNKTNMFDSKINEFEFRRKFIKSFDFIDHDFFSEQIHKLGNKKFINGVNDTSESGNTNKPSQPHECSPVRRYRREYRSRFQRHSAFPVDPQPPA